MLHSLRQVLVLLACGAVLCAGMYQVNHYIAPWALSVSLPGLLVSYAALRLPFGPGLASAFLLDLWLDAPSPLPFGRHAVLLALAFCLVHRLRGRFPRTETLVGVVVALFVNLGLFVAIAFLDLGALPDPAAGGVRILGDLLVSQLLTALVGPWFLALQDASLRLAGAAPAQVVNRFARTMAFVSSSSERPGGLVESHRGYDPRLWLFHGLLVVMLAVLAVGLAHQQLGRADVHRERETVQSQRRIVVPGPRGNIFDREGRLLVGNRPRFAVTLNLDELRAEFRKEFLRIRRNYRESGDKDIPSVDQLWRIARVAVVQRHLHLVNRILGGRHRVDVEALERHYRQNRILPYLLLEDIAPADYAKLLEQLPVRSPLQVYTSSTRFYPHGALAAHVLGYTAADNDVAVGEALPGADLTTFKMRGSVGKNGLEASLDERLQGQAGGAIFRVDPAGYRLQPPLERRRPVQGQDIVVSLDLDLQRAADRQMSETGLAGAAVALDVNTGEILALVSKPDYDLNAFTPRLSPAVAADINARGAWLNRATQGTYPPGSTFKLLTAIAGLRSDHIAPNSVVECTGAYRVGGRTFVCNNHRDRGPITLAQSVEKSCNTFYYDFGLKTGIEAIAAEARRHRLDEPTGVELPHETKRMLVPDPDWLMKARGERWFPGHTANVSIGQGDLSLTPLQLACFVASLARGETVTRPTLLHRDDAPRQRSEPDGLQPAERAALVAGMEAVTNTGTGRILQTPRYRVPGLRLAGKTGTAQKRTAEGTLNFAWFVGFVPVENPQVAVAVIVEGDTPGEDVAGGRYAAPVAGAIFKAWADKTGRYGTPAVPPAAL